MFFGLFETEKEAKLEKERMFFQNLCKTEDLYAFGVELFNREELDIFLKFNKNYNLLSPFLSSYFQKKLKNEDQEELDKIIFDNIEERFLQPLIYCYIDDFFKILNLSQNARSYNSFIQKDKKNKIMISEHFAKLIIKYFAPFTDYWSYKQMELLIEERKFNFSPSFENEWKKEYQKREEVIFQRPNIKEEKLLYEIKNGKNIISNIDFFANFVFKNENYLELLDEDKDYPAFILILDNPFQKNELILLFLKQLNNFLEFKYRFAINGNPVSFEPLWLYYAYLYFSKTNKEFDEYKYNNILNDCIKTYKSFDDKKKKNIESRFEKAFNFFKNKYNEEVKKDALIKKQQQEKENIARQKQIEINKPLIKEIYKQLAEIEEELRYLGFDVGTANSFSRSYETNAEINRLNFNSKNNSIDEAAYYRNKRESFNQEMEGMRTQTKMSELNGIRIDLMRSLELLEKGYTKEEVFKD